MRPLRRHKQEELQSLPHSELVELVLDLEARNAELEAVAAASSAAKRLSVGAGSATQKEDSRAAQTAAGTPRLERAISKIPANLVAASQLRRELAHVVENLVLERQASSQECSERGRELQRLMHSNFFFPDLRDREPEFATYIRSKLIAPYHQEALEEVKALNWATGQDLAEEHRLHVLWTQSDGNCLLHATLLAMWGLHDTQEVGGLSTLRAAMSRLFQEPRLAEPMRRRWVQQINRDNVWEPKGDEKEGSDAASRPKTVEVSEAQLTREWAEMVELAARPNAFLDSVHVLALAHALRRPIIILASPMHRDPFGMPLTPIFFRGIYLPFERQPSQCCRQPLLLCFQDAHFMPLVPLDMSSSAGPVRVPLADGRGEELPLRFALEEELGKKWALVHEYLDTEPSVELPKAKLQCHMALLRRDSSHPLVREMMAHFVERGDVTFRSEREEAEERSEPDTQKTQVELRRSISTGSSEGGPAKRQKQEEEDARLSKRLSTGELSVPSEASSATVKAPQAGASAVGVAGKQPEKPEEELDAEVTDSWSVKLPRGARPGDTSVFKMPKGCTDRDSIDFRVPKGSYEGSIVVLTATFRVKGKCIKALREVTNLPRNEALPLLAKAQGDPDAAAREYFESH